ncbi:hypothetical protein BH10ACT7_BH10ACT7_27720 [soil metagenome]
MTVTPPEPLPPASPADVVPASPYATVPATPVYAPATPVYAPAPVDPRRDKNPFGIAALIIMIVSFFVPLGFFLAPIVVSAAAGSDIGWGVLGGILFFVIGMVPGAALAVIAVILAIVSLVRSNRKALGIITLVLSTPLVLFGLLMLPGLIGGDYL